MKTGISTINVETKQEFGGLNAMASNIAQAARTVASSLNNRRTGILKAIAKAYSGMLEEEVTVETAARILNAQAAFVAVLLCGAAHPVLSLACVGWFATALLKCRS